MECCDIRVSWEKTYRKMCFYVFLILFNFFFFFSFLGMVMYCCISYFCFLVWFGLQSRWYSLGWRWVNSFPEAFVHYCLCLTGSFSIISLWAEILHSKVSLIIYRSLYHVCKIYKELSYVYTVSIFCWWLDWGNVCKLDCWTVYLRFLQFGHKLSDPDDQCFTRYISPFKDLDSGYPTLLL